METLPNTPKQLTLGDGPIQASLGPEATVYRNAPEGLESRVVLMEIGRSSCYYRVDFRDSDANESVAIKYYPRYTEACIAAAEFCGPVKKS
jgi:hypothetical protein